MKKSILLAAGAVLLAAAVSAFVYVKNENNNSLNELFEANVEVLTNDESSLTTWSCDGSAFKHCSATCGKCGTTISGRGNLTGMHKCN